MIRKRFNMKNIIKLNKTPSEKWAVAVKTIKSEKNCLLYIN